MSEIPVCIDISHHQGECDFDQVAASGCLGIIHKCTEGTSFVDPARASNCSRATQCGLAISTYHWLSTGSDPNAQMEFYLSTLDPVQGERVVIDYEQDGCTLNMLKTAVQALLDYGIDLRVTIYSGHLLKEQLGDDCDEYLASTTDLWLAQYTDGEPSWPDSTYPQYALWQYSETGEIPGIDDAYVDLNHFNGDEEAFLEWISLPGSPHQKLPPPTQTKRRHPLRRLRPARRGPDVVIVRK